jgi:diacylglycerol kinase family enzyme
MERRTPCVFIGNNPYRCDAFAVARRPALDGGVLCLYIVNRHSRVTVLRLAIRALLGRLEPDRDFSLTKAETIDIAAHGDRLRVALDGETLIMQPPLRCRVRPRALRVIAPEQSP